MTFVDMSAAQEALEGLMEDQCIVKRNKRGTRDSLLDRDTGRVVDKLGQPIVVYGPDTPELEGKCKFRPQYRTNPRVEGGTEVARRMYIFNTPLAAPVLEPGDEIKILASARDAENVGLEMRVEDREEKTITGQRTYHCEVRQRSEDRP